jgi:hypothetical protein
MTTENRPRDFSDITICLAKFEVQRRLWANEHSFECNSRAIYMKTYVCFVVAGDILHMLKERPLLLEFR